ncbi:unnamed protein product, partial [Hapterophycus canaliculatus]
VPSDQVFAYPPPKSREGSDDADDDAEAGKTQDAEDAGFASPLAAPPSTDDFFCATRRYAGSPQSEGSSPAALTAALAGAGAAGAAVASARAGAEAGDEDGDRAGAGVGAATATGAATPSGGGARSSSSAHSSSTISAVSAGSMETKHDGMGDARGSSLSPASRASGSGTTAPREGAAGSAAAAAAAAGGLAAGAAVAGSMVVGAGAGAAGAAKRKDEDLADVEVRGAQEDDERLAGEEISASGRMALADFLLGTSDVTSPASAAAVRVGSLATVMEEGPLAGALPQRSRWLSPSQGAEGSQVGSQVSSSGEGTVIVQVEPGSLDSSTTGSAAGLSSPESASGVAAGAGVPAAAGMAAAVGTVSSFHSAVSVRTTRPMLATDRSESSGSEHSSKSEHDQQLTPRKPPALVATGSGSGSGLIGHPTSTRSSVSSPGSNLVGVSLISSTTSTDSFDLSPESSPRKRRSSPMPPLPPVKESSEWSSTGTAAAAPAA